ncbi:SAG family member [Eimeria tenella]|uniref:SAG family member n=1 Tax=Eimeria tenella TaxID=5802 RepID=U6KV63_EIMTE|nr:SAG family member [Eimeria tenella]CDJ41997.1 SAG family member [Eimeria tenella]|eukprot:XP_013232747.1 SAG family member [Eimeria tenella]
MLRVLHMSIVFASVFCGQTESATTTGKAETLNCLGEMNEARMAAGLPKFEEATQVGQILPEHSSSGKDVAASTLWDQICKKIMGVAGEITEIQKLKGMPAYYPGEKDCKAAVQSWKDGFSLFNNQLPPTYVELGNPEVYNDRGISFVALYNPKASPVASCAFATCTTTGAGPAAAAAQPKSQGGHSPRRLQAEAQTLTAVICLTNPEALTAGAAPFKEDEWQKIAHAMNGTESVKGSWALQARPSLALGLVITLFAYGLF